MTVSHWLQFDLVAVLFGALTPLLGGYMAKVYGDGAAPGDRVFGPVERLVYRLTGIDPEREQRWTTYALLELTRFPGQGGCGDHAAPTRSV